MAQGSGVKSAHYPCRGLDFGPSTYVRKSTTACVTPAPGNRTQTSGLLRPCTPRMCLPCRCQCFRSDSSLRLSWHVLECSRWLFQNSHLYFSKVAFQDILNVYCYLISYLQPRHETCYSTDADTQAQRGQKSFHLWSNQELVEDWCNSQPIILQLDCTGS